MLFKNLILLIIYINKMKINSLWILCLTIRSLLVISIYKFQFNTQLVSLILFGIGIGFFIKSIYGSNDEIQISKVFWHETRLVHSILYILSSYYLYIGNKIISSIILFLDVIFSILYRITSNN